MITATLLGWVWRLWQRNRSLAKATSTAASRNVEEIGTQTAILIEENGSLRTLLAKNEERIAVLERIVTDEAHTLTREIETLRGKSN